MPYNHKLRLEYRQEMFAADGTFFAETHEVLAKWDESYQKALRQRELDYSRIGRANADKNFQAALHDASVILAPIFEPAWDKWHRVISDTIGGPRLPRPRRQGCCMCPTTGGSHE